MNSHSCKERQAVKCTHAEEDKTVLVQIPAKGSSVYNNLKILIFIGQGFKT